MIKFIPLLSEMSFKIKGQYTTILVNKRDYSYIIIPYQFNITLVKKRYYVLGRYSHQTSTLFIITTIQIHHRQTPTERHDRLRQ